MAEELEEWKVHWGLLRMWGSSAWTASLVAWCVGKGGRGAGSTRTWGQGIAWLPVCCEPLLSHAHWETNQPTHARCSCPGPEHIRGQHLLACSLSLVLVRNLQVGMEGSAARTVSFTLSEYSLNALTNPAGGRLVDCKTSREEGGRSVRREAR